MNGKLALFTGRLVVSLVILIQVVCPADAFVLWANSSGSANGFNWSGGGSVYGLFGDPNIIGGNTFLFTPSNFRAQSANGIPAITSDRLEFNLSAHQDYNIIGIQIIEYGDYGILDTGKVSVSGTMFVTNLDISPLQVLSDNFDSIPTSPISSGTGQWSAQVGVTGFEWKNLKVVLNNNLMAISSAGSVTFIEKKLLGDAVSVELILSGPEIPEPLTAAIMALGGAVLALRRKSR
jgi:hypothetical protein